MPREGVSLPWYPRDRTHSKQSGNQSSRPNYGPLNRAAAGNQSRLLEEAHLPGRPRDSGPLFERTTFFRTASLLEVLKKPQRKWATVAVRPLAFPNPLNKTAKTNALG